MIVISYQIIILFAVIGYTNSKNRASTERPSDWRIVNFIAEQHPYIVALLNSNKSFICTGTIISKQAILTSGHCVKQGPDYIAVSLAVIGRDVNEKSLHKVAFTKLHSDYVFKLNPSPNSTQIHSNIGLVFAEQPVLTFGVENADVGDYFAAELRDKELTVVGLGYLTGSNVTILQKQAYHHSPCTYPKWYYCVCGFEYSVEPRTYEEEFGEGAPVLYGSEVVAVAVTNCGRLKMSESGINYNIFTVIGPYKGWIWKTHLENVKKEPIIRALSNRAHIQRTRPHTYTSILFLMSKLLI